MNFGEILRELRKRKGVSPEKLAFLCKGEISGGYIRKLESNPDIVPTLTTASILARGLGVKPSDLIDQEDLPPAPTPDPEAALSDLEVSIKAYIPVYAEVSAGPGMEPIDYVASTRAKPAPETYRAFRVKGLCLEPEIKDGDTLIVDTALSPRNGDLVVCIIDGQASVKKYHDTNKGKWLENHNGKYQPEDVHMVGVVVEFNRRRR
jgi:SOS-response transcriptional repressor LexA